MRLLLRFVIAALMGFLVSCLIALASYSLGLWLGRSSYNLRWIIYGSIPFGLAVGIAAAVRPRRKTEQQGRPMVAVVVGAVLGVVYTFIVARYALAIPAFVVLMLSCWVPAGISAMLAADRSKQRAAVITIAILCLAAIVLPEPIFNAATHNQQLTVALVTPSDPSTVQLAANPETLGFVTSAEIQIAKNEVTEHVRAIGYSGEIRVLSLSRQGKGKNSLAILVVRTPITKVVALPEPDSSTVVYVQQSENWEKKPSEAPTLSRSIELSPPSQTGDDLGFFSIPDASGVSLVGRITGKVPDQQR